MSVSQYRGDVDRLTKEIADLQMKASQERARATQERGNALRVQSSIRGTSSQSLIQSKLRQIQRHDEEAVRHERRAADYDSKAATKQRSLSSAQKNLERALEANRRKEERESKRRRDDDLRRLRELENAHRTGQVTTPWRSRVVGPSAPVLQHVPHPGERKPEDFKYDVCLSFAGEDRTYVEMIAHGLKAGGLRVFYDADEPGELLGKELTEHFHYIYRQASRYCVMFISAAYAAKPWARLERRSALERALEEQGEYILPLRFDDTELPGLRSTIGYIDLHEFSADAVVELLVEKVKAG